MDTFIQKCLVPNCSSTTDVVDICFFDFPTEDREMIRAWNKALGFRANCKHIPDPKICEKHFLQEEIDRGAVPVKLISTDAVPSVGVVGAVTSKSIPKEDEEGERSGIDCTKPSYCRLCAKMERQPLKHTLGKMMKCSDTAKLLGICLESSRGYDTLPSGVCDACSHMMKFLIKFVRSCSGAQEKLVKIFTETENDVINGSEEKDVKPQAEGEISSAIKKEMEDASSELPTDYLVVGLGKDEKMHESNYIVNEETEPDDEMEPVSIKSQEEEGDLSVKTEPYDMESDSDFEMPKNFEGFSGSESRSGSDEDDDDDDEYEPEEEMFQSRKQISVKFEDDEKSGGLAEEKPKKKRGRPRKDDPRQSKGSRKPREKREKATDDKPASLCKQICQICGKILSSSATFNVHMMTHTQQKDIVCPICDRRFYVKQQLKIHIESIHEKKDFVCNICGLKCRWRKSLRRHMLLHDDNPYKHKCTYCDKAFARPNQLRYHVMKHTGDRVYCDICGADYRFNYMLTQHKIRKHGIVVEGVQLYKQSSRKKKSEGVEQASNPRRSRAGVDQHVEGHLPPSVEFPVHPSIAPIIQQMALSEHERTNQSDITHASDMGSPATTASFATIGSPEPSHFPVHQQSLPTLQQQQPQQHHQQSSPMSGFNGAALAMPMPSGGLIGFPSMSRQ